MKLLLLNLRLRFTFSYLLLSLLLTVPLSLSAQVFSGTLSLESQEDVDDFSYTEVTGFLIISGSDINNLDSLSSLTSVEGDLIVGYNPELTNLNGLSALTSVGRTLEIIENAKLNNLDGLSSLISVGEELPTIFGAMFSLLIASNPELTNLDGLSSLSSLNEISKLWILKNSKLTRFCGLYTALSSGVSSLEFQFIAQDNSVNPTMQKIIDDGSCIFNPVQIIADLFAAGTLNKGQANILTSKLNSCHLNVFNQLVNAWVNAGILAQGQADVLIASAAQHCAPAPRIVAQQVFTLGQNYPNPARTHTHTVIPFTLATSGKVSIQLYDATGKMVRNLMDQYLTEGTHQVKVNLQSVWAGTYFYKFQVGEQIETLPIVIE